LAAWRVKPFDSLSRKRRPLRQTFSQTATHTTLIALAAQIPCHIVQIALAIPTLPRQDSLVRGWSGGSLNASCACARRAARSIFLQFISSIGNEAIGILKLRGRRQNIARERINDHERYKSNNRGNPYFNSPNTESK
jgi:hypothetical protein